jgi:iron-sulfur cluster assembly protein
MSDTATLDRSSLVRITDRAQQEIRAIFERQDHDGGVGLRLGVIGGGCSGLSYEMEFSERRNDDTVLDYNGFEVFLDPKSTIYLKGITLDFQDGLQGKGFVFANPNATNTCGCGESFSV